MPIHYTRDGKLTIMIDDAKDRNTVVYGPNMEVLFNRLALPPERGGLDPIGAEPPPGPGPVDPGEPIVGPVSPEPGRIYQVTRQDSGGFRNRIYSYWSNAFIDDRHNNAFVFAGHNDGGPRFYRVGLSNGNVTPLGPVLPYGGETEGWSWDKRGRITLIQGPRLIRVNPFDLNDVEVLFDISGIRPGCDLWQPHSSEDGRVHSATVRRIVSDGKYPYVATVFAIDGQLQVVDAIGDLDESHVDAAGEFGIMEESHDNRIRTLRTGEERWIRDAEGALSHIDCGHGVMVGEDNQAGGCFEINLHDFSRRLLFPTWNVGHISVRGGTILNSNEHTIQRVRKFGEGGSTTEHVASHGMRGSGYDFQVGGNLDPTGRLVMYLSNRDGDEQDIFLVQV